MALTGTMTCQINPENLATNSPPSDIDTKDEDELDSREDSERYDDRTGDEESQDGQRYGDKRERDSDDQSSWSLSKKKKRKQSNPIRYQSLCSPLDLVTGKSSPDKSSIEREASSPKDLSSNENSNIKCPHCTECFANEEILANHINLDHVQKMIEKQLLQFHQFRRKASSDYLNFPIGQEKQKEDDESGDEKLERLKSEGLCPTPFGLSMSTQAQAAALAAAMSSPLTSSSSMGFPQIPGLIPSMPHNGSMDMQQPVNLSLSMGAFPGHVPPYLIPLFPQGHSPPVTSCPATSTSSASHTPSGMRIFNPEAYCELCHKEFCNKYFLKTHKANKHGIYSMDSFVNLPYGNALFAASLAANTLPAHLRPMLGPSPPVSEPNTIKVSGIINKESYCEVCDKEFCNKYFLKKHKLKIHGVDILPGVTEENTPPSSSTLSGSPSHASDDKPVVTTSTKTEVSVVTSIKDTLVSSSVDQGTSSEVQPESLPAATQADDSKEQKPSLPGSISNKDSTIVPTPQVLSAISIVTTEPKVSTKYSPAQLQSMGVINPDAFCDICCKEFCNKYFLRTHRQNKHGACASEASPGSGSNSVCNTSLCNTGVCNTSVCTTSACNTSVCNTSVCNTSAKTPLVPHTSEIMSDLQKLQFMSSSPPSSSSSSMVNSSDFRIKEEPSEHMELACNFCSRPFASKHLLKMHLYYNHNVPLQENSIEESKESPKSRSPSKSVTPPTEGSKTSIEYDQVDEVSQDLSSLQNLIRELNGPSSENKVRCHMCFQEMDNKYFLRAHMMTQHGTLLSEENVGLFAAISGSNYQKVANLTNREETTSETKSHADLNMRCDICLKVFPNKVILKQHMIILHGMKDGCIRIPEHMKTELTENSEQPVQTKPRIPSSDPNSPQKQQNGSSPGNERRNYCQLCNKELCNKYFMKTHMLKMHGITVNERSSSNGVEMAGNSMIGGVTCDICHKELCSKYFLKVHKQNTHGISEDGTPIPGKENIAQFPPTPPILRQPSVSPPGSISWTPGMDNGRCISHYSEICPLCDRRFKSIKWLKTHMANDHREHIKENILLSNLANVPISIDPQAMDFAARSATKVAALVQGHSLNGATENPEFLSKVIASQKNIFPSSMEVVPNDSSDLPPRLSPIQPTDNEQTPADEGPKNFTIASDGTKLYNCSFCKFNTKGLSNLYAHEKCHASGEVPEGDHKYVCKFCHRSYRYSYSLQKHLQSHRISSGYGGFRHLAVAHDKPINSSKSGKKTKRRHFRCSRCQKRFQSKYMCKLHIYSFHEVRAKTQGGNLDQKCSNGDGESSVAKPRYNCSKCSFYTRHYFLLKQHIKQIHKVPLKYNSRPEPAPQSDIPLTYAMPQNVPESGPFIMQPFLIAQPDSGKPSEDESPKIALEEEDWVKKRNNFVPSLVYLPVSQKISKPLTVAFTLTPAE